ncbi:hypothetical protein HYDPIDRAFT_28189 [Hydnomerulius pinastri MD-312]|uniref:Uncharacterized protein n=1 Tax=Hydnomerulius pinastri MD-312 TaxID=994086 RepID=A0A0C9WFG9_9AGAM|nr:hypothetical protein HYDPIDRAFT_28189 [Hydnomerulius pinastri MD-312]
MPPTHAGIVHQPPGQSTIDYLPLEEVGVKAWVVDVSARIVLTQIFDNPSDSPTGRAKYVFPLPASAAVCAFELEFADGRVIVGEVKDKEGAAQAFTNAVEAGQTAGLVERVTDDIFTISVGSIPARQKVTARITLVMDLLNEGIREHVRLQLPMSIAERYGTPPPAMQNASSANAKTRVHITIDIQTSDVIHEVRSPTHPISLQRYKTRSGRKSQRRMSATWKSSQFLAGDFVVTIHADGLDKPRCFAEVRTGNGGGVDETGTIAMQLTLVPAFQAPKIPSQEYIFVIDRSGSMTGASIETAKRTLAMLLRLLPSAQTTFNVFSFGSKVDSLWTRSIALDQTSLDQATLHVQAMQADYGGTETPAALHTAFNSRGLDRPAVVFLLTDGQIHGSTSLDPFIVVSTAVRNSPPHASLRLFVLGIGTEVSSDMCESLARKGHGECLFALSAENITGKCARLLNAGRSKNIERVDIHWGNDASTLPSPQVSFSPRITPILPPNVPALAPPPAVQQAPHTLTKIFPGMRFTVFAIMSFRSIPTSVKLLTKLEGVDEPLELEVDVIEVKSFKGADADSEVPLVHTLAARRLITELDEGRGPAPVPAQAWLASEDELRKAGIMRLGLEYKLVSKYTSFVAIEKGDERASQRDRHRGRSDRGWIRSRLQQAPTQQGDIRAEATAEEEPTVLDNLLDGLSSLVTSVFDFFGGGTTQTTAPAPQPRSYHPSGLPGSYARSDSGLSDGSADTNPRFRQPRRGRPPSNHSTDTFTTLSSLEGSSGSSYWTNSRSPSPRPRFRDPVERAPSPEFIRDEGQPSTTHPPNSSTSPPNAVPANGNRPTAPVPQAAYDLFFLQHVDGSFVPSPALGMIVGDSVLTKAEELGFDKTVWTTAVAVAYLKKYLEGEPDLLDALLTKAAEYVDGLGTGRGGRAFEDIVRTASGLLVLP